MRRFDRLSQGLGMLRFLHDNIPYLVDGKAELFAFELLVEDPEDAGLPFISDLLRKSADPIELYRG